MDCPSEEQLIRSALAHNPEVQRLDVDLAKREVTVWHHADPEAIRDRVASLGFGGDLLETVEVEASEFQPAQISGQSRVLRIVLIINATMFVVELVAGWMAESAGLLADSLDMLADAAVYGVALWATAKAAEHQRTAARVSGWLQLVLALGVIVEVVRRTALGSAPEAPAMLGVAALALVANVGCMLALARHRTGGAHMQASWIFTSNDVIANVGVIVAGLLVGWTSSAVPDLIIGALIGGVVLRGALMILRLSRP